MQIDILVIRKNNIFWKDEKNCTLTYFENQINFKNSIHNFFKSCKILTFSCFFLGSVILHLSQVQ